MGALALICITVSDWYYKRMFTAAFYLILIVSAVTALIFFGYELASTLSVVAFFAVLGIESVRLMLVK
jgi:hypothetical protein